jgi:UDP-glucuronate 4-epimerase
MAIHKFTRKILSGEAIEIYGDGSSSRDYTYIDDIINGIENSLEVLEGYQVFNLGNSSSIKIIDLIRKLEEISGEKADIKFSDSQPGDVFRTFADIEKAKKMLKYEPETNIDEGLKLFIKWYKEIIKEGNING